MWQREFFVKDNGRIPVEDFLNELSPRKDLPYILNALDRLSLYGYELRQPYTDYLQDDIYELRVKTINGHFRLLYFFFDGKKIILAHGF